jgi:hypothetical protein
MELYIDLCQTLFYGENPYEKSLTLSWGAYTGPNKTSSCFTVFSLCCYATQIKLRLFFFEVFRKK